MMKLSIPDSIFSLKPYVPGKPIDELERDYGVKDIIKLASNENPLGPSPMALKAIQETLAKLNRYPDGGCHDLVKKLSDKFNVAPDNIVLGNGSDDIIGMLVLAFLRPGDEAVLPKPSFLMYDIAVRSVGATPVYVPLKFLSIDLEGMKERISPNTRMIFICNPNNPTGTIVSAQDFDAFIHAIPQDIVVVVDEAYIEFARDKNCVSAVRYADMGRPVVTLRTFSKVYGLAGLRVGYGIMAQEIAALLNRVRHPFNVNSVAQTGAAAALEDTAFFEKTIRLIHEGLDFFYESFDRLGIKYVPTQANFFLIEVSKDANKVFESLLRLGIIIRSMASYGYSNYIRVNAGLPEENTRLVDGLIRVLR